MFVLRAFNRKNALEEEDAGHLQNLIINWESEVKDHQLRNTGVSRILSTKKLLVNDLFEITAGGFTVCDDQSWTCGLHSSWIFVTWRGETCILFGCRLLEGAACSLDGVPMLKLGSITLSIRGHIIELVCNHHSLRACFLLPLLRFTPFVLYPNDVKEHLA